MKPIKTPETDYYINNVTGLPLYEFTGFCLEYNNANKILIDCIYHTPEEKICIPRSVLITECIYYISFETEP